MNPEKITRFMNDEMMESSVYSVILTAFLKKKGGDVQTLAASRIAIDLLSEAWGELKKYKEIQEKDIKENSQIGL